MLVEAAQKEGFSYNDDYNSGDQEGVGFFSKLLIDHYAAALQPTLNQLDNEI